MATQPSEAGQSVSGGVVANVSALYLLVRAEACISHTQLVPPLYSHWGLTRSSLTWSYPALLPSSDWNLAKDSSSSEASMRTTCNWNWNRAYQNPHSE